MEFGISTYGWNPKPIVKKAYAGFMILAVNTMALD